MWLELHDVTNPTTSRGTGNFKISTRSNGFVIDEDPFYPSIGITNAPVDFTTPTFTCDTTALSRHSPRYKFSAAAAVAIPTNSFMKVTLPAQGTWDYQIPTTGMSCELEGYGTLQCGPVEEGSNELHIYGFPATAQAATLTVYMSGIINPAKATTTG
jgi:hypothetical protein